MSNNERVQEEDDEEKEAWSWRDQAVKGVKWIEEAVGDQIRGRIEEVRADDVDINELMNQKL